MASKPPGMAIIILIVLVQFFSCLILVSSVPPSSSQPSFFAPSIITIPDKAISPFKVVLIVASCPVIVGSADDLEKGEVENDTRRLPHLWPIGRPQIILPWPTQEIKSHQNPPQTHPSGAIVNLRNGHRDHASKMAMITMWHSSTPPSSQPSNALTINKK